MSITSSSAQNRQLADWYRNIKNGNIKLPRFQRHEAWDKWRIESFLSTIISNLPVGVTLILNVGEEEKFISRFISTAEGDGTESINEHLLDGQQRLTAFWRSMHNNYEHDDFFIYLPEFESYYDKPWDDDISVLRVTRYLKGDQKYPLWVDQPDKCFARGCIPMQLFRPDNIQSEVDTWIEDATWNSKPEPTEENYPEKIDAFYKNKERLKDHVVKLRETIAHFNLPYLSLPASTPKEVALKVFINMNTNSKPLSLYDIIVAEVESEMGKSLHDLQDALDGQFPKIKNYSDLGLLILTTSALLQNKLPNHRGMVDMNKTTMVDNWEMLKTSLNRMAVFLESQSIFDKSRLPTNAVLAVIAAAFSHVPESGDLAGRAEILLRKYLWSSFFTDRYENSAASRAFPDYIALKNILSGEEKDDGSPYSEQDVPVLNRDLFPISSKEELLAVGWPKRDIIRARAILSISNYLGAEDFADGQKISRENISNREYHHIFPAALLEEAGIKGNIALNCALISGDTNRNIGRKDPLQYLRDRYKWIDEEIVNNRLNSHLIPVNELANGGYEGLSDEDKIQKIEKDYMNFIDARADLVLHAAEELTEGYHVSVHAILQQNLMPRALEDLDEKIASIEKSLRKLIATKLGELGANPYKQFIPPLIREAADNKLELHKKKFPGMQDDQADSFQAKLNYLTLGETAQVMQKKDCWDQFEDIFGSKNTLQNRVVQLVTLRNTLAHNNELNDVMVKDGEAAIIWFENALGDYL